MGVKKFKEIKSIIEKIILDHVQYSCSTGTYKKLCLEPKLESLKDMELRHKLIDHIKSEETHFTFFYLKENESLDNLIMEKLATLSFIDFISKEKTIEAIEFAKEYSVDKSVFKLIGYGACNKEEYENICQTINRDEVMSQVNSYLFSKGTGRKESLLHGTESYFNTLRNNKE